MGLFNFTSTFFVDVQSVVLYSKFIHINKLIIIFDLFFFQLPKILKSITLLQTENELFCFNPENALFISNKWDAIACTDSDDETYGDGSDMDEVTRTWALLKSDVKSIWPCLKEENIFKMNLIDVNTFLIA